MYSSASGQWYLLNETEEVRMIYHPVFSVIVHGIRYFRSGTCNFFQVAGQIATLKWSRGPDNITSVNGG